MCPEKSVTTTATEMIQIEGVNMRLEDSWTTPGELPRQEEPGAWSMRLEDSWRNPGELLENS